MLRAQIPEPARLADSPSTTVSRQHPPERASPWTSLNCDRCKRAAKTIGWRMERVSDRYRSKSFDDDSANFVDKQQESPLWLSISSNQRDRHWNLDRLAQHAVMDDG